MDNSAARNKWMDRKALENYRHAMRICCMNALHVCSDEALSIVVQLSRQKSKLFIMN